LGLCIVAILALCSLLATTASAETLPAPAWATCVKASPKDSGKYKNKTCSEAEPGGKGGYEVKAGVGKAKGFKGKSAKGDKPTLLVKFWEGTDSIACESAKDSGTPAAPNLETHLTIAYSKCKALGSLGCTSAGAKSEEVKITGLKGELGYIKEGSEPVVGLRIESEAHPGGSMAEFECGVKGEKDLVANVENQVIGVQSKDVNSANKEFELNFEATEDYGVHEFDEKTYSPSLNPLGWATELAEIEACSGKECVAEHPAHVIKGVYCGKVIKGLVGTECTPETYTGLNQELTNKGEDLLVKT